MELLVEKSVTISLYDGCVWGGGLGSLQWVAVSQMPTFLRKVAGAFPLKIWPPPFLVPLESLSNCASFGYWNMGWQMWLKCQKMSTKVARWQKVAKRGQFLDYGSLMLQDRAMIMVYAKNQLVKVYQPVFEFWDLTHCKKSYAWLIDLENLVFGPLCI